jgi:hypothetical protein
MSRCCCCCCLVGYFLVKVKTHSRCKDSHIYRETGFQGRAYEREKQDIFGKVFLYSSSLSDFNRKIHIPMQQSWPFVIGIKLAECPRWLVVWLHLLHAKTHTL